VSGDTPPGALLGKNENGLTVIYDEPTKLILILRHVCWPLRRGPCCQNQCPFAVSDQRVVLNRRLSLCSLPVSKFISESIQSSCCVLWHFRFLSSF
jgi:hypothetical protein